MNNEIIEKMEKSTTMVVEAVMKNGSQKFLKNPAPGKWSAAEILEHLNISDKSAMLALLRDGGMVNEEQMKNSMAKIEEMLAYNNNSWVAPEAAEPKGLFTDMEAGIAVFLKTRNKLIQFAKENELNNIAGGFEHPRLGKLSKAQWFQFLSWHAEHHGAQILRIAQTEPG